MSRYVPGPVTDRELAEQADALSGALDAIETSSVTLDVLTAEPAVVRDGMIVYADGSAWNPGSGAGVYAREAGAWVKL